MEKLISFLPLLGFVILIGCFSQKEILTKNDVIKIVKEDVIKSKLNPVDYLMNVDATPCKIGDLGKRHPYFTLDESLLKEISNKIRGNTFWYVYLKPKQASLGGDFHFFIDVSNGKILYKLSGE